MVVEDN